MRVDFPELGGPKMSNFNSSSFFSSLSLEEQGKRETIFSINLSQLAPFKAEIVKKCCGQRV